MWCAQSWRTKPGIKFTPEQMVVTELHTCMSGDTSTFCSQTQLITFLKTLSFTFDDDDCADSTCSLSELMPAVKSSTTNKLSYEERNSSYYYLVPPENCDVAERNFCVFAQRRNFCHGAQLSQISGCFCANNLPFWGNSGANWTSEHT